MCVDIMNLSPTLSLVLPYCHDKFVELCYHGQPLSSRLKPCSKLIWDRFLPILVEGKAVSPIKRYARIISILNSLVAPLTCYNITSYNNNVTISYYDSANSI